MNSERLFTVTVTPLGQLSVPSTSCRAISICSSCVCGGCPLLCCCCCCCCAKNDMFRFLRSPSTCQHLGQRAGIGDAAGVGKRPYHEELAPNSSFVFSTSARSSIEGVLPARASSEFCARAGCVSSGGGRRSQRKRAARTMMASLRDCPSVSSIPYAFAKDLSSSGSAACGRPKNGVRAQVAAREMCARRGSRERRP